MNIKYINIDVFIKNELQNIFLSLKDANNENLGAQLSRYEVSLQGFIERCI